jgi:ribosomal protein L30
MITIKQVRSRIGCPNYQKRTLDALGLRKIGCVVVHNDNSAIRGMIEKVKHLIVYKTSKKLYIIGNGFDLHHGIQSSYFNFRDFLRNNNPDVYDVVDTYLANTVNFWHSFEENLANLDEDVLLDKASNYYESYGAEDWSDDYHHSYQRFIDEEVITPLTDGLRRNFTEWVRQMNIEHTKNQLLDIDKNALFLTFNYTSTLEFLYRINRNNITYIHNKAEESSELVFGHNFVKQENIIDIEKVRKEQGKEAYQYYLDELSGTDPRLDEGEKIINSYYKSTNKPTVDIIKRNSNFFANISDVGEIIILGHSLSDIDMPYFKNIFNHLRNKSEVKWTISFHKEDEKNEHQKSLKKIGVKQSLIKSVKMDYFYPKEGVLFP